MILDDVLSKRDEINAEMQLKLDAETARWGVKVTAVEIREISPPPAIQEAMTRLWCFNTPSVRIQTADPEQDNGRSRGKTERMLSLCSQVVPGCRTLFSVEVFGY